jgi:4-diphosphocytidyl-2-C-methyl-D-erythritol kinase
MTATLATPSEIQTLRAPAKINLGLRLLGVRDDGYHTLESVFAPIEIWDELEIEVSPGEPRIDLDIETSDSGELPAALSAVTAGPDNLVVRAAAAFRKQTGLEGRIRLRLRKQIPAGAGLGGGSSDAAAVLLGLASVFDGELAQEALHALGLSLGADVPFFLSPTPALVSGIGEKIENLTGLPALDLVVANPGISLATAEVYRATDALPSALTEPKPGSTMRAISRLRGETGDLAPALGDLLINDLEPAARRLCPPVARLIKRLKEVGAIGVSMSGSGATVFGVFESGDRASEAAEMLRASEPGESWIRVTRIITSG